MKKNFLRFFCITSIFLIVLSCKPRHNNETDSNAKGLFGLGGFAKDVTGKRSCPTQNGFLDSGNKPTWVFHWTDNELALNNPKRYIEEIVRAGNAANADPKAFNGGAAGNGLYVATDPFQSIAYGKILVAFPIRPHAFFPFADSENAFVRFTEGCSGAVYHFNLGIKSSNGPKPNGKVNSNPALVLWDLAPILPSEIASWEPSSRNPNHILDAATVNEIKYLKNSSESFILEAMYRFIPFLNGPVGSEESQLKQILIDRANARANKCIDDVLMSKKINYGYLFLPSPFIPKDVLTYTESTRTRILSIWKTCWKEIGIGNGNEASFEEIVDSLDLYINKNIPLHLQKFKTENALELARLKQIIQYWTAAHTIENWTSINE